MMARPVKNAPLTLVPPPPDDAEMWKRLLNCLYLLEEDALFRWAKDVRRAVRTSPEEDEAA